MNFLNINDVLGFAGEVASRTLFLQIEEEYLEYNIKIEFKLPNGEKYGSGALEDKTRYVLDEYLLSRKGFIDAQIVAYNNDETYIAKSLVRRFIICNSVNAGRDLPDIYKLQDKDVTVTEDETEVTADAGYYGLGTVKIALGVIYTDIVSDLVELNNYDISKWKDGDKMIVLFDALHNDRTTVYELQSQVFNFKGYAGGTQNHSDLSNLDYESSGHTGFAPISIFDNITVDEDNEELIIPNMRSTQ